MRYQKQRGFTLNCHAEKSQLSIPTAVITQGRDPEQQQFRMTFFFERGFTLIELLVVILIIGILAAVALPQYQKAVEKSRATQAIAILKAVYQAAERYQLASGAWPTSFGQLDITIPWTGTTTYYQQGTFRAPLSDENWSVQLIHGGTASESRGVSVGRISGNYSGAAWYMMSVSRHSRVPTRQLICVEGKRDFVKKPFKQTVGSYCQKIFHGTDLKVGDGSYYYKIPF